MKVVVDSPTINGHTALHIASVTGQLKNVMMLVFEGKANVLAQSYEGMENIKSKDKDKETPLHVAKTGKIMKILFSRTTPDKLMKADTIEDRQFFDQILKHHPSVLKSYLDLMVNSREDLESDDPHLVFDLSMFDMKKEDETKKQEKSKSKKNRPTKITLKANHMDKHLRLMEEEHAKLLCHPVMKLFGLLKWHPNVIPYLINFLIFFAFLIFFTAHSWITVDFLQCDQKIGSDCKSFSY